MWKDLTRQGGPFEDCGALAGLRQTSLRMYLGPYGRWLDWLWRTDPTALTEPPVARATLARLKAWLSASPALSPTSRKMYFVGTLRVLRAAGPNRDWSAHLRVEQGLAHVAGCGDPSRKHGKILSSRVLLEAGLRHAGQDAIAATTPLGRAKVQRDGAMVALLAMMPTMRHRAFAGLTIGQSLLVTDRAMTVVLSEELTKTGVAWEAEVPEPAAAVLRRYLSESRPFLLSRAARVHDVLWVGNQGEPMSYSYVGKKIPDITGRLTGARIPPHFFRDCAATTLARESPKAALVIAPLLGHAASGIAERHYIQAGSVEVGRELAKVLKRLKEKR
jgi:integrase